MFTRLRARANPVTSTRQARDADELRPFSGTLTFLVSLSDVAVGCLTCPSASQT